MTYEHQSEGPSTAVEEACCGTECLVQPRFFHGQLLTDADLNQLLSWTESKFRLQRARDGWGVVCGLELSLDPKHPTHVMVQPGQAIDCCGRDLVVCEPISLDLSDACPKEECLEPPYNRWGKTSPDETKKDANYEKPQMNLSSPTDLFRGSQALDLFLHYSTEGTDSQVGLGRGRAGQGSECEYSRLKETVKLKWEPASNLVTADIERVNNFVKDYQKLRDANLNYMRLVRDRVHDDEPSRSWLLQRLETHPLQQFGFVRDWITAMDSSDLANNAPRLMFFIGMDAVLTWLHCGCSGCSPSEGLRVGRAWLQGPDNPRDNCRIIWVNDQPPHRRELRSESCYPTIPDCINLAPYLWQDSSVVFRSLVRQGIPFAPSDEVQYYDLNWEKLENIYTERGQIMSCDEAGTPLRIRATVVHLDAPFGSRVIGFSLATT